MSVEGDNGLMGAPVHLPSAGPETITEMTPCATVTPTQSLAGPSDVVRLDLGCNRGQDQVLAQWNHHSSSALQQQACAYHALKSVFKLFWNPESFIAP